MHTRETEPQHGNQASLGDAAKDVAERASALARLELELASLELKGKVAALGVGIGLGIGAAVFGFLMLGFTFATLAAVLDTFLDTWLALLITTAVLVLIAGILGLLAKRSIQRGTPPVPKQAIEEAKLTTDALKSDGG